MDKMDQKSFWQSPLWREILEKSGQAEVFEVLLEKITILVERRRIWKRFSGLYILGIDKSLVNKALIAKIQKEIAGKYDLFLQIEPIGKAEENRKQKTENRMDLSLFKIKAPFRRFLEPVTAILDLQGEHEESLIENFAEKGRYNIRLALKRGIMARFVSTNTKYLSPNSPLGVRHERNEGARGGGAGTKNELNDFYNLLKETTSRDGFSGNSLEYYENFLEVLEEHNAGGLVIAEKDGIIHAGGIFVYWEGQAIYYYGASSSNPEIRRDMATYLVQWEAIREALRRNCHTYDFLGISPDGTGKLAGVTEFKLRFNPEKIFLPKEQIIVYKPLLLFLLQLVSRLRKLIR